jgi:hypothetical protein
MITCSLVLIHGDDAPRCYNVMWWLYSWCSRYGSLHGLYGMVNKSLMEEHSNILCIYCTLLMMIDNMNKQFHGALTSLSCLEWPRVL